MPSKYDPVQDEIDCINFVTDMALSKARRTGVPPKHECGAAGYGFKPWDRCAGCEWQKEVQRGEKPIK